MSLILIGLSAFAGIISGKLLFKKWINHLSIYCFIMGGLVFFYELKLLPYDEIIPLAWFFIIASFLSFYFGILTVITMQDLRGNRQIFLKKSIIDLPIFADGGKVVKYAIIVFSLIGLFVALHRWYVLLNKFGSISAVLINAAVVYRLNVSGEIKEFIPILPSFVYVAVFLSGIYTAYKKKFTFWSFLPFIGIILKEFTNFGRAELLLTFMQFVFTFFLFRHLLNDEMSQKFKFSKKNAIIASTILVIIIFTAASFVGLSRGSQENFVGQSSGLKKLKGNIVFSPSVYLYLSSDIGVFSKYLQLEREETNFGQNTFFIVHTFLSRIGFIEKPPPYQPGYNIPMWTNTGTYLRELHADFGLSGILLGPYLLGLLITFLWYKFYREKKLITFAFLVYLYLIIGFSFLVMVTRLNQWHFSLFMIVCLIPFLEKLSIKRKLRINNL